MATAPLTSLCERCQVLQFDDSALGFGARTESGKYYFQIRDTDDHRPWLKLQPSPQHDALCEMNVRIIRSALQDVESEEGPPAEFFPTRLIEVGTKEKDTCRLVVTDSDLFRKQRPKYAALSYCWGPPEDAKMQFKTEPATFQDRTLGFRLDMTSPVVRDAVEVVRSLDIPYLWVDAVCIIQGDSTDWERESAQMTEVYQNAHLTICTPSSTSCREEFLGNRIFATVGFRSRINADAVGSYSIRPCGVISDPRFAEGDYESMDNSDKSPRNNWWKRGWTFQELFLSKRVLLFGIKLHLILVGKFWSENNEAITEGLIEGTFAVISIADELKQEGHEFLWMSIIEHYTERQLTFESDKLPALGGIAKLAVLSRGDQYLAGIRKGSLHRELFWTPAVRTDAGGQNVLRVSFNSLLDSLNAPTPYIAPSWSWARWKGSIRFDESTVPFGDHVPVKNSEASITKGYESIESWMSTSQMNLFGQAYKIAKRYGELETMSDDVDDDVGDDVISENEVDLDMVSSEEDDWMDESEDISFEEALAECELTSKQAEQEPTAIHFGLLVDFFSKSIVAWHSHRRLYPLETTWQWRPSAFCITLHGPTSWG
ncbi:hypothetical protein DL770_004133 [Monosporascus sp. CRB-9-2]|nr:hypothetical protein DL770_004133 [Monosporascus sp. CRB-9-2]